MQQDIKEETVELANRQCFSSGVCFDSERLALEGVYPDELSSHRAKRVWIEALETSFLLDVSHDFQFKMVSVPAEGRFLLRCDFLTTCGRYAFWRLTHNQAPEAQYLIETGHIPYSEARHADFLAVPDLRAKTHEPMVFTPMEGQKNSRPSWMGMISKVILRKIRR